MLLCFTLIYASTDFVDFREFVVWWLVCRITKRLIEVCFWPCIILCGSLGSKYRLINYSYNCVTWWVVFSPWQDLRLFVGWFFPNFDFSSSLDIKHWLRQNLHVSLGIKYHITDHALQVKLRYQSKVLILFYPCTCIFLVLPSIHVPVSSCSPFYPCTCIFFVLPSMFSLLPMYLYLLCSPCYVLPSIHVPVSPLFSLLCSLFYPCTCIFFVLPAMFSLLSMYLYLLCSPFYPCTCIFFVLPSIHVPVFFILFSLVSMYPYLLRSPFYPSTCIFFVPPRLLYFCFVLLHSFDIYWWWCVKSHVLLADR